MQRGFQHILVPVYPTLDAEPAVKKAAEWCNEKQAEVQVLNMLSPFAQLKAKVFRSGNLVQQEWISKLQQRSQASIKMYDCESESLPAAIANSVAQHQPDLVVIPAQKKWWPFSDLSLPAALANSTGVPVLKLKRSSSSTSIVVPVQQSVTSKTLEQISLVSKKSDVDVHLVSYQHKQGKGDELAPVGVLQAYQWLKSYVKCPVEFSKVSGTCETKAVINYLLQLNNDVLLLR